MTEPTTDRNPTITTSTSQIAKVSTTAKVEYKVSLDSIRMRELAQDIAAINGDEEAIRDRPSTSFKSIDEFEQELDD